MAGLGQLQKQRLERGLFLGHDVFQLRLLRVSQVELVRIERQHVLTKHPTAMSVSRSAHGLCNRNCAYQKQYYRRDKYSHSVRFHSSSNATFVGQSGYLIRTPFTAKSRKKSVKGSKDL